MNSIKTPISPKQDLFSLCKEIAQKYDGWVYTAGAFKYKLLKHSDIVVHPLWSFNGLRGTIRPRVVINNKRVERLFSELTEKEKDDWTFKLNHHLQRPEKYHAENFQIFRSRNSMEGFKWRDNYLTLDEAADFIQGVLQDGIEIIEQNYNLNSERELLENLPEEYETIQGTSYCRLYEEDEGAKYCLARIMLGDFDYIERYYRDEIKTFRPKHKTDLERIIAALPELKKRDFKLG
ncbi:hypothetical protein L3V77_10600 [Vibrio sp. DW001]|uniref:hypothetical protein n=1 Tax=Vibrio sp. DW001 TaxID=2912315 RepID=UPI0023AFCEB7|nr:hypothetical protein [Vibrio sp. DW001]WED25516.1 hypothetical protein L3V77_10600 [Vibrio sp. DW001]